MKRIRIALAGNPNAGKTTLFNALTGSYRFVGNWPGVTVEKKEGTLKENETVSVTDLPGIYSLSPYSPEEVVARNFLIDECPDVILNIVDGTHLERNLYLTVQLKETGIPLAIAVNFMDEVEKSGNRIDTVELSHRFGCPVVALSALRGTGVKEAAQAAVFAATQNKKNSPCPFSASVERALSRIEETALGQIPKESRRWYAVKLFERDRKVYKALSLARETAALAEKEIRRTEKEQKDDAESIISRERYRFVDSVLSICYRKKQRKTPSVSERIDRVVIGRLTAFPIFAFIMLAVFFIVVGPFGTFVSKQMNRLFGYQGIYAWLERVLRVGTAEPVCPLWLSGLVLDGIVAGVGAVLAFVPRLIILFLLLGFLEECGYMARIAFILDCIFRRFGLSGKSFIVMMIGIGCSVPAVMASRTVENEQERRITVISASFIPCSAKLPLIAMISTELFGGSALVSVSAYFIGMASVLLSGVLLKKNKRLSGEPSPFVMELPPYRFPTVKSLLRSAWERSRSFIDKAGTVILLSSVALWFLTRFGMENGRLRLLNGQALDASLLAKLGSAFAWLFRPLGWGQWQAVVASFTGLIAKENIVGTMGILYGGKGGMTAAFSVLSGFSFLLFNLLCAPCCAAVGAIRREMASAKWTWFAVLYQSQFAYAVSLSVYQFGLFFLGVTEKFDLPFLFLAFLVVLYTVVWLFSGKPAYKNDSL